MAEKKVEVILDWLTRTEKKLTFNKSGLELLVEQLEENAATYIEIKTDRIGKDGVRLQFIKKETEVERYESLIEDYKRNIKDLEKKIENLKQNEL